MDPRRHQGRLSGRYCLRWYRHRSRWPDSGVDGAIARAGGGSRPTGKSDIAWRDTAGNVAIWLMDGPTAPSAHSIGSAPMVDRRAA